MSQEKKKTDIGYLADCFLFASGGAIISAVTTAFVINAAHTYGYDDRLSTVAAGIAGTALSLAFKRFCMPAPLNRPLEGRSAATIKFLTDTLPEWAMVVGGAATTGVAALLFAR